MGNWLITILAVVLLLAILDGVRRAIVKQRAAMKVSRNLSRAMQRDRDDDMDILSTPRRVTPNEKVEDDHYLDPEEEAKRRQIARELPGQVRVVQRRALEDALQVNRQVQESFMSSRKPLAGSNPQRAEPEQVSLNLEEQVPTLMDSVPVEEQRREPELNESESLEALSAEVAHSDESVAETTAPAQESTRAPRAEPLRKEKKTPVNKQSKQVQSEPREKSPVEEVLIINVMAREGDHFEGNDLLRVMVASGMRFGEMNIFHYHQGGAADGPVVFSLANMVVPGVFDLAQMEEFATPGVSLFLALPIEGEAIKAFEQLLATSRQIAELLGGELKDENRSVFTAQTAEHYRQRVMEYQRRKALARAQA
ncbi:cell division protein ZipA [Microbulbifer donghaiensis]|uniref:Cell division protein ZipA n=1 Tax=Microbulbifer donghaiensis TaxID=494016 RepID=A0A1M5GJG8_9GAMM|nr:cell division protein ZipA [Microbulbifer donghaiensis]SHG03859.1 cell division protein ZipA [Microbulbifer donghaiensis]